MAVDTFYIGTWKIVSAKPGPWGDAAAWKRSAAENRSFLGRTVVIDARGIRGPGILACADPRYEVKDYTADMLFQGMFGEMQARDKAVDPIKTAESVGFRGASWKTLETGCEHMIDYHFIDAQTATFALNHFIYVMKKQR